MVVEVGNLKIEAIKGDKEIRLSNLNSQMLWLEGGSIPDVISWLEIIYKSCFSPKTPDTISESGTPTEVGGSGNPIFKGERMHAQQIADKFFLDDKEAYDEYYHYLKRLERSRSEYFIAISNDDLESVVARLDDVLFYSRRLQEVSREADLRIRAIIINEILSRKKQEEELSEIANES